MKKIISIVFILVLFITMNAASAGEYTGKPIKAKYASGQREGDFMTIMGRKFADHMKEWSDGKIDIAVFPLGTLGTTKDITETVQLGVIQFAGVSSAWWSTVVPQTQVMTLNYLWPSEKVPEVLAWIMKKGEFMPLLEESYNKKGLVPLALLYQGWMWLSSNKEIKSLDDMKGLKLRLMSSKLLVENYRAYGTAPTTMPFGEVYSGLQMGLIEAQINPVWAIYSMKFYEVQDYITNLKNETIQGIPVVNKQFFEGLPKNVQQEITDFWWNQIIPAGKFFDDTDAVSATKIKKNKPNIKFNVLDDATIAAFRAKAEKAYPTFVEIGGEGSQEIIDALLRDIKNAKIALGIN